MIKSELWDRRRKKMKKKKKFDNRQMWVGSIKGEIQINTQYLRVFSLL